MIVIVLDQFKGGCDADVLSSIGAKDAAEDLNLSFQERFKKSRNIGNVDGQWSAY